MGTNPRTARLDMRLVRHQPGPRQRPPRPRPTRIRLAHPLPPGQHPPRTRSHRPPGAVAFLAEPRFAKIIVPFSDCVQVSRLGVVVMGARGPAAKPKPLRRNRNAKPAGEVELEADAKPSSVPELPGGPWRVEVLRWWRAWCETPAAVQFSSTEWERLFRAAPLCDAYWRAVEVQAGDPPDDADFKERAEWVALTRREVRDAHAALLNAEKGLPATDYERRRNGIQIKPTVEGAPVSQGRPRLKVV